MKLTWENDIRKRLTEMGMIIPELQDKPQGEKIGEIFGMPVISRNKDKEKTSKDHILIVGRYNYIDGF